MDPDRPTDRHKQPLALSFQGQDAFLYSASVNPVALGSRVNLRGSPLYLVLLIAGLALAIGSVALVWAMHNADRRAKRQLYVSLGFGDGIVDLLMSRNGDVLTELTLARRVAEQIEWTGSQAASSDTDEPAPPKPRLANTRIGPAIEPQTRETRPPAQSRRRLPHPGRQGRS